MYSVLSSAEQRQLRLLHILYRSTDWITMIELAEAIDCSDRILSKDLSYIENNFSSYLTIERSKFGIRGIYAPSVDYYTFVRLYMRDSVAFNILEQIFFHPDISTQEISDEIFVSPSTVYRNINLLNQALRSQFNFEISNSPYRFVGPETNIRLFFMFFFREKYSPLEWPFEEVNLQYCELFLSTAWKVTCHQYTNAWFQAGKLLLAIGIIRTQKGHLIQSKDIPLFKGIYQDLIDELEKNDDLKNMEQNFNFKLNLTNAVQLFMPVLNQNIYIDLRNFQAEISERPLIQRSVEYLNQFLDTICLEAHVHIEHRDRLILSLHNYAFLTTVADIQKDSLLIDRKADYIETMSHFYPDLYDLIVKESEHYFQSIGLKPLPYGLTNFIYALYTGWEKLHTQMHLAHQKPVAYIVSNYSSDHAHRIQDALNNRFGLVIDFHIYKQFPLKRKLIENLKCDLIISTFDMPHDFKIPNLYVQTLPTEQDYNWLAAFFKQKRQQERH
ncbi:hypothetical protein HMPREF2705_07375 [Aerococcus sp. HMSC035B07]|uniref:helix-turn-helix domain-containing protein n=1 Tax=Aerococcus sp. HMSC035B07 TaxID=1715184 RepID=UPI0008A8B10A|nr:helix-turn-helix domain-containing protein [Aerococcus sp. HMSC035B07]OHO43948.1 hypothetical protein HMPREF2705_07375 [Aerococcus sp. HMSC035B07]